MNRPLSEYANIYYGKSPSGVISDRGTVPVIGTGGVYGAATRHLFMGPAVVVPRKGSLSNPQYVDGPFWPVDTTYAVMPKRGVDARWLYSHLEQFDLTRLNEATGVPSINRDWLLRTPIAHVGTEEQRRIADRLASVDEAIAETELVVAKRRAIKEGVVDDLFNRGVGPGGRLRPHALDAPEQYRQVTNVSIPNSWVLDALSLFVPRAVYGVSVPLDEDSSGIAVLRMNNIVGGRFDVSDMKYSSRPEPVGLRIRPGDVLFNRTNSFEHVGKAAIWREELLAASFASYLVRLDVDQRLMRPAYLAHWLNLKQTQIAMRRFATPGVHQVNINPTNLRRIECAAPGDLAEQDAIVSIVDRVDCAIATETRRLSKLRQLRSGLMQDLLTGRVRVPLGASDV